jgi:hypothetical protein
MLKYRQCGHEKLAELVPKTGTERREFADKDRRRRGRIGTRRVDKNSRQS